MENLFRWELLHEIFISVRIVAREAGLGRGEIAQIPQ